LKKKNVGTKKKRSLNDLFASSMIFTCLGRLSSLIYRKLSQGIFGGMFTSYARENQAVTESMISRGVGKLELDKRLSMPVKQRIAEWVENSRIIGLAKRIGNGLLSTPMKTYGIFLFSYAFYSAIIYIFKLFYLGDTEKIEPDIWLIVSISIMLVASVAIIASRHCLGSALKQSPISRAFLFDIVGLRSNCLDHINAGKSRFHLAFLFGLIFGCLSFFMNPLLPLVAVIMLAVAYVILIKPEFGVLAIITALPFLPTMVLVAAVLYVAVCFFIKVMIGKRSVKFDLLDGVILAFMVLMIGGGIFSVSKGSIAPMLVYVAFMLGYFLVVNLIRSREWVTKCIGGAVIACVLVALYGLYQNFFGTLATTWQDTSMFGDIEGRVVSTFENPNVLAEYLIMMIPLIFAMMLLSKTKRSGFAMFLALGFTAACLVYTWSRGAWLGIMIGMLIFMLIYSKKTFSVMLLGLFAVPFLPFVLPDSIVGRFASIGNLADSSTSYRVNIWRGVIDMIGDHWVGGIGIGFEPFRAVYPEYALEAIEAAPHSHNLFLQILVEIGIVGLIVFVAAMVIYAQSSFSLNTVENRKEKFIPIGIFCGTCAVLAQGMTDYIWYNYRVYLMFWLMIGLAAASRRVLAATAGEEEL